LGSWWVVGVSGFRWQQCPRDKNKGKRVVTTQKKTRVSPKAVLWAKYRS